MSTRASESRSIPSDPPASASLAEVVGRAVAHLEGDGFVAYPTETVWGLGAPADRPVAIDRLTDWKGRGSKAPLSVLTPSVAAAEARGCFFGPTARRLAKALWPGPLMLVVPCTTVWAPGVARADGALGLRCSSHPLASALAEGVLEAGLGPLTSTSLNRSGESPARDVIDATGLLAEAAASGSTPPWLVSLDRRDAGGRLPSTVVDCTDEVPEILRVGAIDRSTIERTWSR